MGNHYFYNFCISELDSTDLRGDILSAVRRSYFDSFERIRDKITVGSEDHPLLYDYSIEKGKALRWTVKDDKGQVLQEVTPASEGRYYLCFYRDGSLYKRLLFSRLHTLLKAEYTDENGAVSCSIEPRKVQGGLCLLYESKMFPEPLVLSESPAITDERIARRMEEEFSDYTAVASTDDGIILFLSDKQTAAFRELVQKLEIVQRNETEESFIGDEAPLFEKINAKDFNVKRNLSSSLDISQASVFGAPVEDIAQPAEVFEEEPAAAAIDEQPAQPALDAEENQEKTVPEPDKMIMADGAMYSYYGELDENGNRSGYGRTMTDLGRTAYEGCYLDDKRSGKGAYFYKDGTLCYSGDWSQNARHGVGVGVSARDGSLHMGRWKNNKPEGNGVRMTSEGNILFVCKELEDGKTVLMHYLPDDTVLITKYDEEGKKISEKTVSLTEF